MGHQPFHRARGLRLERLEDRNLLSGSPTIDLSGLHVDPAHADPTHILVRFRAGQAPVALSGTTIGRSLDLVPGLFEINLTDSITPQQAVDAYRADPRVAVADLDYALTVSWVPKDPRFSDQWHLRNTGQNRGTPGADIEAASAWNVIINANRVPVAVMDTGIDYTHPDLYLNIWVNQGEIPASRRANLVDIDGDRTITFRDLNSPKNQGPGRITDLNRNGYIDAGDLLRPMIKDANGKDTGQGGWADGVSQDGDKYIDDLVGWNSNKNTNDPFDDYGHGTHVAGTIGAMGNNSLGVTGVAWQTQLVGVKFLNKYGAGSIGMFISGLDWALSKGIRISNNSWNDSGYTPILYDAVNRARAKGHIFVAAAGNQGRNADTDPAYPAGFNLDNVVSVGATDRNDRLASFSNYGLTSVDIAAPGVDILSTNPGKSFGLRSGTSMATPQVTAAMALVWTLRPEWTYNQVIDWVLHTADRLPGLTGKLVTGRLNLNAAVRVPPRGTPLPQGIRPSSVVLTTPGGALLPSNWLAPFTETQVVGLLVSLREAKKEKEDLFSL